MTQIYAIQSEAGPIKIGVSTDPSRRMADIIVCQPFDARLIHAVAADDLARAFAVEKIAHFLLSEFRRRGEWFDITPETAVECLEVALDLARQGFTPKPPEKECANKRTLVPLSAALLRAVEDYRFSNRIETRAEAVRQLIERGLASTIEEADEEADQAPASQQQPS